MIRTARLVLRRIEAGDLDAAAALNGDAEVMRYFPEALDRAGSDAHAARMLAHHEAHGWGVWAVVLPEGGLVGMVGPKYATPDLPCAPAVEVAWRIARPYWGRGYATEAARAAIGERFAAGLDAVVALTAAVNAPSRAVMERLGMTRDPADDFDHPGVADTSPLRRHVLYRLHRSAWAGERADAI